MLRFCFGASGSGKSTRLYKEIIDRSLKELGTNFFIIVPDQFTMQTQKDVVVMHPYHAIMNIDVLSFGRLSHRIFEEAGLGSFSVLNDLGKSLCLRRVSDILGDKLPVIGKNMHKPGYIDEVKSTISEFMQYGIGDEALSIFEEKSSSKGALYSKLKDLRLLYSEFLKYISGKYITTEETLDVLCRAIPDSEILKGSVIVFDGFTGFTPIQYRVVKELLSVCKEVVVSLTISGSENPYQDDFEEQELFMLTKKTVLDLEKLEYSLLQEKGGSVPPFEAYRNTRNGEGLDIIIRDETALRLKDNPSLAFLEKNLFRYNNNKYEGSDLKIHIYSAQTMASEVRQTMIKIKSLLLREGYAYRDIALVCGNLDSYSDIIKRQAEIFDIPVYIDKNTSLLLNPFIEYITSAINIVISGYKYEDVFHYMRSGMTNFSNEDTDLLENYVRALGIKGKKQWEDRFLRRMPRRFSSRKKEPSDKEIRLLEKLDNMRESIKNELSSLFEVKRASVKDISAALIKVIESNNSYEKLMAYREKFEKNGDSKKVKEYDQIYAKVMDLFRQMDELLGADVIDISEYRDILKVGLSEIEVGTIPQDVDRVIVGDIERTRLCQIKALFFVGVNDGNIPSSAGTGGILSDIDRQFLMDLGTDATLAPTPRQQMYIQRLYLYMNLTKPTDTLYLSFAELGTDGKSLRPAYLIPKITSMFPSIEIERPENGSFESQTVSLSDSKAQLSELLREYALGILGDEEKRNFITLIRAVKEYEGEESSDFLNLLTEAAFKRYEDEKLSKMIALSLYGANLENSVSRLEKFASCCYAHFLQYGLHLEERKEYEFEASDLGNVFHAVLEKYTGEIISKKIDWKNMTSSESEELLNRALTECVDGYGDTILLSSVRNQYMIERIRRILKRTVDTLQYQISKGRFEPAFVEMDFSEAGNIDEINITLSEDEKNNIKEKMKLHGRIDRIDLYEDSDHLYVKVIDFKSGGHKFNVAALFYGLQLQLVMYMNVAMAIEKKLSPAKDVQPAAILYYHVDDPMAEGQNEIQPDVINEAIRSKLRTTGLVNENMDIINLLDEGLNGKSDVIPVEIKKDGTLSARSTTVGTQDYEAISKFTEKKIREFGRNILDGDIWVNPYEMGDRSSCTYCSYKSICGFDEKIEGYSKRRLDISADEAMNNIRLENN